MDVSEVDESKGKEVEEKGVAVVGEEPDLMKEMDERVLLLL